MKDIYLHWIRFSAANKSPNVVSNPKKDAFLFPFLELAVANGKEFKQLILFDKPLFLRRRCQIWEDHLSVRLLNDVAHNTMYRKPNGTVKNERNPIVF